MSSSIRSLVNCRVSKNDPVSKKAPLDFGAPGFMLRAHFSGLLGFLGVCC